MQITCRKPSTPRDLEADVRVFAPNERTTGFISLDLRIGEDEITVMLPPHAYHRARSIADLWSQLVDRAPDHFPASPEIIGAVS